MPEAEPTSDLTYARGFAGQYFEGIDFDQFLSARNDGTIEFQSSTGSFAEGQQGDHFSAKWFGEFAPPILSEIQSYQILYGSSPDSLSNTVTVDGSQTSAQVTGLSPGTWYVAIRVIDTDGLTSKNSDTLTHTLR